MFEIFIPLGALAFMNLLVFFKASNISEKLAILTTISLAFIGFMPNIGEIIPTTYEIKLIHTLVHLAVFASFLTILDSAPNVSMPYEALNWTVNGWFIYAMITIIVVFLTIIIIFVVHKLYWEKVYLLRRPNKVQQLRREEWSNTDCDDEFKRAIARGVPIKMLK